jgi:glycosyltransferase involved in cell wall biosynthesis
LSARAVGTPLVSVLMPFRNAAPTLASAIVSVLSQSLPDFELLVLDDGSTDRGYDMAASFEDPRIRLLRRDRSRGLPACLNELLACARGRFIARMDADDIAFPRRFEKQIARLLNCPEVDMIGTSILMFRDDGSTLGSIPMPTAHEQICHRAWIGFPMAHPTWMGKSEWFRRYGYREQAVRCEDQDLLLRAYRDSRYGNIPEVLLGFRENQINLRKALDSKWNHGRIFAAALYRERQYGRACASAAVHTARAVLDFAGVASTLEYRLLRHRLKPVAADVVSEWRELWHRIRLNQQSGSQSPCAALHPALRG